MRPSETNTPSPPPKEPSDDITPHHLPGQLTAVHFFSNASAEKTLPLLSLQNRPRPHPLAATAQKPTPSEQQLQLKPLQTHTVCPRKPSLPR